MEEAEKLRKKQEKRDYKATEARRREQVERDYQQKKEDDARNKIEADLAEKNERKNLALAYKAKQKELTDLCTLKLKGTKYDRFWVESILKRFNTTEKLEPFCVFLTTCESVDKWLVFVTASMQTEE